MLLPLLHQGIFKFALSDNGLKGLFKARQSGFLAAQELLDGLDFGFDVFAQSVIVLIEILLGFMGMLGQVLVDLGGEVFTVFFIGAHEFDGTLRKGTKDEFLVVDGRKDTGLIGVVLDADGLVFAIILHR